jgi:Mg2+ and Co2+ transporter CorA
VITGIFGMNFEENQFPSFQAPWGFTVVIMLMLVNSVLMLAYFRWRKWI